MTRHARRPIDGSALFWSTIKQEGAEGGHVAWIKIGGGGVSGVVWLETAVSVCGPVRRGSRQLQLVMEEAEEELHPLLLRRSAPGGPSS